jgi:hypothetical protein
MRPDNDLLRHCHTRAQRAATRILLLVVVLALGGMIAAAFFGNH